MNKLCNDIYNIQMNLSDFGDNNILTSTKSNKIYLIIFYLILFLLLVNNCSYENVFKAQIFLPYYKEAKILMGGEGQEVLLHDMLCKSRYREKMLYTSNDFSNNLNNSFFTTEKRNCDCCKIF